MHASALRRAASAAAAPLPERMRAVLLPQYGAAQVLRIDDDVPLPSIGAQDVLVKVAAAAVNPLDCRVRAAGFSGSATAHARASDARGVRALALRPPAPNNPWP